MKKSIIFIIFISLFIHLEAQMLITTAQMNNINSSQSAFEGQIYKNTETNIFYIGLSGGTLKTIGELNTISSNASLTGDGTSGSPLGIAPMGASTGQALVWNGTSWAPSTVASGWSLTGNSGTNPPTNFLGTTDYNRLIFKTNNIEWATFLPTGYFGLGITNPSATFHNNGTTVFSVRTISNRTSSGDIGSAGSTVDIGTNFAVNQTTPGLNFTLPSTATAGKMVKISNSGTAAFTMYNTIIPPSKFAEFMWTGSTWIPMTGGSTSVVNKKLVFSAEYAGAVIVPGSGTNHIGDMIGGNTGNNSPRYMNYYEWKGRSSSGIQTYQIILRITLPNDFTEWLNNAIVIDYLVNSGCNLQLSFYNLSNTLLTSQTLYSSGWNTTTIWASSLSSWITPGETVALIITLSSTNNNVVRIGDIILNYK